MSAKLRTRGDRGQTLVEFAAILPIFVLILFGILDFGRAIYAFSTINNAAREGARLAIVDQTVADVQQEAAKHAVGLGTAPADVVVTFEPIDAGSPCNAHNCIAVVRVEYQYLAFTPILGAIVGPIEMAGETTMVVEHDCVGVGCPVGSR